MINKNIFAVDIDGVLADISPEINHRVSKHFGVPEDECKKDKWYMHERFGIEFDVMEQFLQQECFGDDKFWLAAKPFAENIEALYYLRLTNKVVLITGRHGSVREVTREWLHRHGASYHYLLMDSLHTKHKAMKYAGADFMVEDRYQEAKTIAEQGYTSFIIKREYNLEHQKTNKIPGLYWINNIKEISHYV